MQLLLLLHPLLLHRRLLPRVLLRLHRLPGPNLPMLRVYAMTALMRRPRARALAVVDTRV